MASGADSNEEDSCPKVTFEGWQPEAPAGLSFLSLLPINQSYMVLNICSQGRVDINTFRCIFDVRDRYQISMQTKAFRVRKLKGYEATEYSTDDAPGKFKVSVEQRRQRRRLFAAGKTVGRDRRDEKRLKQAVETGDTSLASMLIQSGVDPCCCDNKERTPLHIAAAKGDPDLVKVLLDHGADPNQRDQIGNTPLHLAACTRHTKVVTLLLQAGTDVNALDQTGRTPLHLASGRLRMLQDSTKYTQNQLKGEVSGIIDMMKAYLSKIQGGDDPCSQLDDITYRLEQTSTREEVDHLGSLLSDFASLQLSRTNQDVATTVNPRPNLSPDWNKFRGFGANACTPCDTSPSPSSSHVTGTQYGTYRDQNEESGKMSVPNAAHYIQPR